MTPEGARRHARRWRHVAAAVLVAALAVTAAIVWGTTSPTTRRGPVATGLTPSSIDFAKVAEYQGNDVPLLRGHRPHLGPGDPHGLLLRELEPVAVAVPAGSRLGYAQFFDAQLDSCDGVAWTEGWDGPEVQIDFTWHGTSASLLDFAAHELSARGWSVSTTLSSSVGPDDEFSKHLAWGSAATGYLEPTGEPGPNWELSVQANPDGRAVTGC